MQPLFYYFLFFFKDNLSKIVLVLLSASVERVGVSRMRDFLLIKESLLDIFFIVTIRNLMKQPADSP